MTGKIFFSNSKSFLCLVIHENIVDLRWNVNFAELFRNQTPFFNKRSILVCICQNSKDDLNKPEYWGKYFVV